MKIVIDGNIGSGKSTQLSILDKKGFNVAFEPIDKWPLDMYYKDPERWGFLLQILILQTLEQKPGFVIYERSPISSMEVFWKTMKKTEIEDTVYREEFRRHAWFPDVYIYISKNPVTCYDHIKTRNQEGDSDVSLEYLTTLNGHYNDMFRSIQCTKYRVDGTKTIEEIHSEILDIVQLYQ